MKNVKPQGNKTGLFVMLCIIVFVASFVCSILFKMTYTPRKFRKYSVKWSEKIGKIYTDLSYGDQTANKFDLYVPTESSKETYGLIVYLHAGGFRTGDKSDDAKMLEWLCSLGYVTAGINYTLNSDDNPTANVYTMSMEIKESIPYVIEEAKGLGYNIDRMAMSGGSAGGCLALIYAYRDASDSPVPVKMVFEGVGPSSFYPEDWKSYGLDQDLEAAATFFNYMTGMEVTSDMFGTDTYDEVMKNVSPLLCVDDNTVPTVMVYGAHDTFQPYEGSVRLDVALTEHNVPHEYIVCEHSGHGLQNDNDQFAKYMSKIVEYLNTYMAK